MNIKESNYVEALSLSDYINKLAENHSLRMSSSLTDSVLDTALSVYHSNPQLVLLASLSLAFIVYYVYGVVKQPELVSSDGKFKEFLLEHCTILQNRYWPTLWCFDTHAQTALANMFRGRLPNLPYQREIVRMSDGGVVSLDWLESASHKTNKKMQPVVLFLPGLTGHSQTEYIKSLVPVAHRQGCMCVVFNNRGRGGVDLTTPRTYSARNTEDLREVLALVKRKHPDCPVIGVGISLGGIILGHYLVESGANSSVNAALLISVAWDILAGAESLEIPGLNLMLNKHLVHCLCDMIRPHKKLFEEINVDIDRVLSSKTMKEFDERFTAKLFGYQSVEEYYTDATLRGKLSCIEVPVLCVNAADDMFCPSQVIPRQEAANCNKIALVITSRGGHIGFMEGFLPSAPFFSERLFDQYVKGLLSLHSKQGIQNMLI